MSENSSTKKSVRRKIALCLEYPILQHGGTEVLVRELIEGFATTYDLVLVSDDDAEVLNTDELRGKIVQHVRWTPKSGAAAAQALAATLAASGVDLAHFHFGGTFAWESRQWNTSPIVRLHKMGVACMATNHGVFGLLEGYIGSQRSLVTKLALLPLSWISRMQVIAAVSVEVAVSKADYRALRRRYWPFRNKFRQIYHSRLHLSDYQDGIAREKIVLCAGTIGVRKGQPYLARAFAGFAHQFPDWKLIFVGRPGDPETVRAVEEVLQSNPQQILWTKECSDEELAALYQRSEVFAMPSLHEGLGLSLQEALFYGCACVASAVGGIRDLVQDEVNGLLVPVCDTAALSAALQRLMDSDDFRCKLREQGRRSVLNKGMTVETMLSRYRELYESAFNRIVEERTAAAWNQENL